jgi:hypothetical protein
MHILLSCRHRKRIKVCSVAEWVVVTIGMLSSHLPLETPVSFESVLSTYCFCNRSATISLLLRQFVIHYRNISRTMFTQDVLIVSGTRNHLEICYTYFSDYLYLFLISPFHPQPVPIHSANCVKTYTMASRSVTSSATL